MATLVKVTVAFCLGCGYWVGPEEIGNRCIGDGSCTRHLVKRVGYLCRESGLHRLVREAASCTSWHD